ncbi:ATP-binding protein [Pseudomonas alliivorans]|nr:ATP-binding protein [Pseudomonas alliivorans]
MASVNKVYSGLNPKAKLTSFPSDEASIVSNLAKEFYVTTGSKTLIIRNSKYRYFFLKFPDDKASSFGAKDEIIVLLSPFENFEPRTLDAIEEIQDLNPGYRLDKICAFVISKDEEFLTILNRTIKTHKESRLIIPFTYDELSAPQSSDFFRQRIKDYFFERNLFDFDSPLKKDLYFFGREDTCQNIIDKHQSGQNSSLFGLRRSGKTSILLSVCRRITAQGGYAILLDCQRLHLESWAGALYIIIEDALKNFNCKIPLKKTLYTETNAASQFINDLNLINKKIKQPLLIALDEIEQITFDVSFSENWKSGIDYVKFWHVLRSVSQSQNSPITFLIAGTNPRCLETPFIKNGDNPLYGQIKPQYIDGFTVNQTKQMIETLSSYMGISVDEDIYSYLTREFGGHPFLIRQACSYIKSILDKGHSRHIDRKLYDQAILDFSGDAGHSYCEMVVGVLSEQYQDEYTMLTYLARGDDIEFSGLANSDPAYTNHLIGYGVISKSDSGYDFKIDAVKKHLAAKNRYKKLNLNQPEKLAEISKRRNAVELRLRKLVGQILRSRLGETKAKDHIVSKYNSAQQKKCEKLTFRELFDSTQNKIYFDDLRGLMQRTWEDDFRNVFSEDIEKFNARMVLLNSIGRSDAHANTVSDADMESFRGAMSWLELKIDEYFLE